MQRVIIVPDAQDQSSWHTHEVEDIRVFLRETLIECSGDASIHIYHGDVSQVHDVTPVTEEDFERLGEMPGPFYIITYPGDPITIIIIAVVVVAVAAVVMMMLAPPLPTLRNTNAESPNNELSARTNKARPMARIPDIFGQVWSIPDLLSVPYSMYENHQEVEYAYMCIGRGSYEIATTGSTYQIKDDSTLYADMAGVSVEVYGPNTSPNSGDSPELSVGDPIGIDVKNVKRFTAVNGQTLRPPNEYSLQGDLDIYFETPNLIHLVDESEIDFTDYFAASDPLVVSGAYNYSSWQTEPKSVTFHDDGSLSWVIPTSDPLPYAAGLPITVDGPPVTIGLEIGANLSGNYVIESVAVVLDGGIYTMTVTLVNPYNVRADWSLFSEEGVTDVGPYTFSLSIPDAPADYDLDGTYEILSVSAHEITLSDPAAVNLDWDILGSSAFGSDTTENLSPLLVSSGDRWIGPFTLDMDGLTQVLGNFIAPQGLFKDNGKNQYAVNVLVELELTPVDGSGTPTGAAETFRARVMGSATSRSQRAVSKLCNPTFTGTCQVRARRVSETNTEFDGQVVDEIKWKDVYALSPTGKTDFGDVTTTWTKTYATSGATAVKERKQRILCTRKLPSRISGSTFTAALTATTSAADIISAACLDEWIGRRTAAEVDFDSIYDTYADVMAYFGTAIAGQFNYTFDSDNLSFEETLSSIAAAIHSVAYRRGNVIKFSFEKATEDSTLLFNHRNKLPGSETRTQSFGRMKDFDGVEYQWVDPEDDAIVTKYLPANRSSRNPKKIESVGIRNGLQAYLHAWRVWNRIRYQNLVTEFDACSEAALCIINDRILVADNTRTGTQDGEVREQNVLTLTLSQPVTFAAGVNYAIFLQLSDGTVESIPITDGMTSREVVLSRAPRIPLVLDPEMFARTGYIIIGDDDTRERAFLVSEKGGIDNRMIVPLQAINYDIRYYEHDTDYIDGVIDIEGNVI